MIPDGNLDLKTKERSSQETASIQVIIKDFFSSLFKLTEKTNTQSNNKTNNKIYNIRRNAISDKNSIYNFNFLRES